MLLQAHAAEDSAVSAYASKLDKWVVCLWHAQGVAQHHVSMHHASCVRIKKQDMWVV